MAVGQGRASSRRSIAGWNGARSLARLTITAAFVLALSSCASLGYYGHLANGQYRLIAAREPIAGIVADPAADPVLKARLAEALAARRWAVVNLALPDNGSYTGYADLGRPFAVWNVFAAPELSLDAKQHCFPIAGCVAYRGYYDKAKAEQEAARLQAEGYETYVGGVPAYSTLGTFDDPIVSPLLRYDDARLAATLFHELAHQRYYLAGDTTFSESYASFVEREGGAQWRRSQGRADEPLPHEERETAFRALMMRTREELAVLYAAPLTEAAKREGKARVFAQVHADYTALKTSWGGWPGYDGFFATPMSNAKLLPFGLYEQFVPAFAALFAEHERRWPEFHKAIAKLGKRPPAERLARLQELLTRAPRTPDHPDADGRAAPLPAPPLAPLSPAAR